MLNEPGDVNQMINGELVTRVQGIQEGSVFSERLRRGRDGLRVLHIHLGKGGTYKFNCPGSFPGAGAEKLS
jgi:hypothetical protein